MCNYSIYPQLNNIPDHIINNNHYRCNLNNHLFDIYSNYYILWKFLIPDLNKLNKDYSDRYNKIFHFYYIQLLNKVFHKNYLYKKIPDHNFYHLALDFRNILLFLNNILLYMYRMLLAHLINIYHNFHHSNLFYFHLHHLVFGKYLQ